MSLPQEILFLLGFAASIASAILVWKVIRGFVDGMPSPQGEE